MTLYEWAQAQPFWLIIKNLLDSGCIVVLHVPNLPDGMKTRLARPGNLVQFVRCASSQWHITACGEYSPAMVAIADAAAAPEVDMRETNAVLASILDDLVTALEGSPPPDAEMVALIHDLRLRGLWCAPRNETDMGDA